MRPRSTALFVTATALYWASIYIYLPILAVHAENLGASVALVGIVVGAYGIPQVLLRIPMGIWSDRLGRRKPFILVGLGAAGAGGLILALASDPEWLAVGRGMSGVGACAWLAFTVLFASYFPPERATMAMSQVSFVSTISMTVASYLGGWIAQSWGWHAPFYAAVVLALLAAPLVLALEEKPLPVRRDLTPRDLFRTATVPLLLLVSGIAVLSTWTYWVTTSGFTLLHAARIGATRSDLGMLTAVAQLSQAAFTLACGYLADWIGSRRTVILGTVSQAVAAFMVPSASSLGMVTLSQALAGSGRGLCYSVLMGLSIRSVPVADRATAMGVFQAVYALAMFAGPTGSGLIGDNFGLAAVFLVSGVSALIATAVAVKIPAR